MITNENLKLRNCLLESLLYEEDADKKKKNLWAVLKNGLKPFKRKLLV